MVTNYVYALKAVAQMVCTGLMERTQMTYMTDPWICTPLKRCWVRCLLRNRSPSLWIRFQVLPLFAANSLLPRLRRRWVDLPGNCGRTLKLQMPIECLPLCHQMMDGMNSEIAFYVVTAVGAK